MFSVFECVSMPAYKFEAMQTDGNVRKGVLEADTAKAARAALRMQSLVPLAVVALSGAESIGVKKSLLQTDLFGSRVFNGIRLSIWTRQLAGLVSAGLPLERALTALADEAEDEKQRNLVAALRTEVNAGSNFARALSQHPQEFSSIYQAVIGAGEQSGNLAGVLERLADDLEERLALKSKLIAATLYPAIVTLVAIVIVMFLVGYVVPQVASVFVGTKRALPFLTVAMLAISDVVRNYGLYCVFAIVLGAYGARIALRKDSFREKFDASTLTLPLVGRLVRDYNAARFVGTLAMVREGAPLAAALGQKKRFPGLVSMFARLGEQTGQLPEMLQRAAVQLSNEVQRRALALATILEPLLIVAMGAVVMLIVLAVLMPIIQLNQFVK